MPRKRRRKIIDKTPYLVSIDSLAHDGRGVGRDEQGKVVFVDYALPEEQVLCITERTYKGYVYATTSEVIKTSPHRVDARCAVFGQCGGCVLQHFDGEQQIKYKQEQLAQNVRKMAKSEPEDWLPASYDKSWGYRRRARLGIKYVPKKSGVIIGFRERNSHFIQPIDNCVVLEERVSALIPMLRDTVEKLENKDQIPQVEVSVADNAIALVLRHLTAFCAQDIQYLIDFAKTQSVVLYLQPGKLNSVHPLYPENPDSLFYQLPFDDIRIHFLPTDFIQVNRQMNVTLIDKALTLLDIQPDDCVLDLFSGLGNFTLPIAKKAKKVAAVEGDKGLVKRAQENSEHNQVENVECYAADLFDENMSSETHGAWLTESFDKIVLDPPRSGAFALVKRLAQFNARLVLYVSCGPATLARDTDILVNQLGYRLRYAGVADMFPHTAHVESIALFEK